ncbi:glycoside hydrolase family 55 protein [Chryseobacterium gallinarum]|uniref:glycoside hydrolase family 55 protein n=1 Tax=Chryseobacterium gallinarum TaxID=1324352 RepID=UPI0020255BEF|nr:glycoside hydrolase family 55 protein [Chryseobacterium gallinarum]MCL8536109.1 glycoside hydrolase family 55 protein [Chryseobacterium gallinarum]
MTDLLIIDEYTGEQCKYVETSVWYDNTTPMSDALCDHVVYIQHEHKYYKRVLNDYLTVKMFGAIGDGLTDDSGAIQKAVDFCETTSQKTLFFPPGDYLINTPIQSSRGGVKFLGAGALLREESWFLNPPSFPTFPKPPFSGCSLIVPKNSSAIVFKDSVVDPVNIESIQFLAKEGRTVGKTHAIDFKSEFWGPTWPFVIKDCHFRGFNRAISFKSLNAYDVAWVQITGSAFSQNDECVYFDFANDKQRNLSWGFLFENNKCHDNSRVIYGFFAKELVKIVNNNFEGSIPYIKDQINGNLSPDHYSIDIEIDNAVVQFFGNHFESMQNHAVYISSLRKDIDGNYMPSSGTTALSNRNKVEIFGNNMDGMTVDEQIRFNLTGVQVINKDDVPLSVHACEIVENLATSANIFLNPEAKINGTIIKFSDTEGTSYLFNNTLDNYDCKKIPPTPKSLLIDGEQYESRGNKITTDNHFWGGRTLAFNSIPTYLGVSFKVKNRLDVFTTSVFFNIFHFNGTSASNPYTKYVPGTLFQKGGDSVIVAIIPNDDYYPDGSSQNVFSAGLSIDNLEHRNILVATDITYFTFSSENPAVLPYYVKSDLVEKVGTFSVGQQFVDTSNKINVVTESGTIESDGSLSTVTVSGTAGNNFIIANHPQKLTTGQYIKIPDPQNPQTYDNYKITGYESNAPETRFYVYPVLAKTYTDSSVSFKEPTITIIN